MNSQEVEALIQAPVRLPKRKRAPQKHSAKDYNELVEQLYDMTVPTDITVTFRKPDNTVVNVFVDKPDEKTLKTMFNSMTAIELDTNMKQLRDVVASWKKDLAKEAEEEEKADEVKKARQLIDEYYKATNQARWL